MTLSVTKAACSDDPDLFGIGNDPARMAALHLCWNHCPILADCQARTTPALATGFVMGGWAYDDHGQVIVRLTRRHDRSCTSACPERVA